MKKAYEYYQNELSAIREAGTYKDERIIVTPQRSRIDTTLAKGVVNMCANNYLGLSTHPELMKAAKESYDQWGFGLSSVRFICGTQQIHKDLEKKISSFVGMDVPFCTPPASMPTAVCLRPCWARRMPSSPTS